MSEIVLYPSNWIYNVGVIGLLRVLKETGLAKLEICTSEDGSATISIDENSKDIENQIFSKWEGMSSESKKDSRLVYGSKTAYYANQTEKSIKARISGLFKGDNNEKKSKKSDYEFSCAFCTSKVKIKKTGASFLNQAFGNILLGSAKSFNNMYWNNSPKDFVCSKCEFILMCHHLGFTQLSDGSEIFINAPSFKVMYYLNKFAREAFGTSSSEEARTKREILAMSVIEYATKIQTTLGVWTGMNIEVVSKNTFYNSAIKKTETKIEFFSLPYEVVQILSNRRIASILSRIGEFTILNLVINQDFFRLIELGYRLFRIGLKSYEKRGDSENKFVNYNLSLDKNRRNLQYVAGEIFKLCALIEEKLKKGETYDVCIY